MTIKWSDLATTRLKEIALYYKENRSVKAAKKVVKQIKDATEALKTFPFIAAIDPYLADYPETIRSLIISEVYKVVYYVDEKTIRIITVYDCRQNPEKLKGEIKKVLP